MGMRPDASVGDQLAPSPSPPASLSASLSPSLVPSRRRRPGWTRTALAVAAGLITALGCSSPAFASEGAHSSGQLPAGHAAAGAELGPNVLVFTPAMSQADIQTAVDTVAAQQVGNEMGTQRYALLFEPGTYGSSSDPLIFQVGYYTEVAGLGRNPGDVVINGSITVQNQCDSSGSCTALDNFWRSLSNLTINNTPGSDACHTGNEMWAVSQAAPMRRVQVNGGTTFMDYCTGPSFASGGFVADSVLNGVAINGSQQQFYVRNTVIGSGGWTNSVWNQVFSGDVNAPAQDFVAGGPYYTTLETTPASREKPYLYVDDRGGWNVFVPSARYRSSGVSWANEPTPGRSIPLSNFYVAHPGDRVTAINAALARGKNLLLTPGVYDIDRTIEVKRPDTVVLGLGYATLTAEHGVTALSTADVPGIDVAGITVDAGPTQSAVLMRIGTTHAENGRAREHNGWSNRADPTALQDVFFRIGGPHVGKAVVALEVNSDHTILDDLWIWRADHGVPGSVGWDVNTADTGLVVNGNDVTATGLFVEHFQKYNVVWNGQGGRVVFFQNELPYDAPDQAAYQHDGVLGYAAFKVADGVKAFHGYGMGSYVYTPVDPNLHISHAFEAPVRPGVQFTDILTVNLSGPGTIDHVINDTGGPVSATNADVPSIVASYP